MTEGDVSHICLSASQMKMLKAICASAKAKPKAKCTARSVPATVETLSQQEKRALQEQIDTLYDAELDKVTVVRTKLQ
jgi:hypothetical protein